MIYLLLLLAVGALFAAALLVNASAFRPPVITEDPPEGRRIVFNNGKNRLMGYVWNETGTHGLVILAHGMGTSVAYHLPEVRHFADKGYRVFAFEYSGYGKSTGRFRGFPQSVSDLRCAIAQANDGTLPVILVGHSMGGYAVCAAAQGLDRPIGGIIAYAPFCSSAEAIMEMTHGMQKLGWLLRLLILPVQRMLFGARARLNGVDGLLAAKTPSLILQGSRDVEVTCTGCSLYAHRRELSGSGVMFRLIGQEDSCEHMTIIRKKGAQSVNEDTIEIVDAFLAAVPTKR